MKCEEGRHHSGGPQCARHDAQREKKQHRIECVQDDACEVVRARLQAEHRHVGHVREPRERVIIAGVRGVEGPLDALPSQTLAHDGVFRHVVGVVAHDELVRPNTCV